MRASACVCCEITQGVRFITGIVYDVRSRSHITRGTICYWHRPVYVARSHITVGTICHWHRRAFVVRSHMTGVRFVTGIGVCLFRDHTSQRVRFVTGIGVCWLRDHTSQGVAFVTGIGVCMFRKSSSSDGYIYIYIYGYTDKLSIYLSIKPTSLYPMYHRKKAPKSYPRHSCCCLAKSTVIVDENSS